jgi:hypothetical protein
MNEVSDTPHPIGGIIQVYRNLQKRKLSEDNIGEDYIPGQLEFVVERTKRPLKVLKPKKQKFVSQKSKIQKKSGRPRTNLSGEARVEAIIRLRKSGLGVRQIKEQLHIHCDEVSQVINSHGYNPRIISEEEKNSFVRLYQEGTPLRTIAHTYSRATGRVSNKQGYLNNQNHANGLFLQIHWRF